MGSPMGGFVRKRAVVIDRLRELLPTGHVHRFGSGGPIECTIPTIPYLHTHGSKELLRVRNALVVAELGFKALGQLAPVNLLMVEHCVALAEEVPACAALAVCSLLRRVL